MYLPVAAFSLNASNGRLVGHAAPATGPGACIVHLVSDGAIIAAGRATRFSKRASARGLRLGWCGVEVPGLGLAAAAGDRVEARCGVSGKVLWRRTGSVPAGQSARAGRVLSVEQIVAMAQAVDTAASIVEILPFAQAHLRTFGAGSFIEATYETLLRRGAEQVGLDFWMQRAEDGNFLRKFLDACLASPEQKALHFPAIPGPFNGDFRYDLTPLG